MPRSPFELALAKSLAAQRDAPEPFIATVDAAQQSAFRPTDLDLDTLTVPKTVATEGAQLLFLRRGSHPGARLDLRLGGSTFLGLRPGCRIVAPFKSFQLTRPRMRGGILSTLNTPTAMPVKLLAIAPGFDYFEPRQEDESDGFLWPLMGSPKETGTWRLFSTDADPADTGTSYGTDGIWFDPFGFKKLRLFIDTDFGGTRMLTMGLTPWLRFISTSGEPQNAPSYNVMALNSARIDLSPPATATYNAAFSTYRFRVIDIDNPLYSHFNVDAAPLTAGIFGDSGYGGELTFQASDPNPNTITAVKICVCGIEG